MISPLGSVLVGCCFNVTLDFEFSEDYDMLWYYDAIGLCRVASFTVGKCIRSRKGVVCWETVFKDLMLVQEICQLSCYR